MLSKNVVPLNAICVFIFAAKAGSFKLAAEQLCLTPGAISRQIKNLEQNLGIKLFERHCREVKLSQLGELYLSQIEPGMLSIEIASKQIRELTQRPTVQIDTSPTFAMHWLIPRLGDFRKSHPNIDVSLHTSSGAIKSSSSIDLYIRRDPEQFAGMKGDKLMVEHSLLVSSPKFLFTKKFRNAEDIVNAPLIAMNSRSDLWSAWLKYNGLDEKLITYTNMDNTILAIQAAIEGLGIALIPRLFLSEIINNETLVALPNFSEFVSGSYQLLGHQLGKKSATDIFTAWLMQEAQ